MFIKIIKGLVFATTLNFLIPIYLQPDGVNFWYFKLRLFDLTKFISFFFKRVKKSRTNKHSNKIVFDFWWFFKTVQRGNNPSVKLSPWKEKQGLLENLFVAKTLRVGRYKRRYLMEGH